MSVDVLESLETEFKGAEKDFVNLLVEFRDWLTPQEKLWDNDEDQLAELFTEFLRSPLKRVPEATITQLQGQMYDWMRHHPAELHFLAKKIREPIDRSGSPDMTAIEPWNERWNKAQMKHHGEELVQPIVSEKKKTPRSTTAEKPLRD